MTFYFHKHQKKLIALFIFLGSLIGCKQLDVFEQSQTFRKNDWKSDNPAKGQFLINDTTATYQIFIIIRHTDAYRYNNIWLNVGLAAPGDPMYKQKVNLQLGEDATGWEGTGMNDIWEVRKNLFDKPRRFIKPGIYKFELQQIMRDDPLQQVMSAGLRVEKAVH